MWRIEVYVEAGALPGAQDDGEVLESGAQAIVYIVVQPAPTEQALPKVQCSLLTEATD